MIWLAGLVISLVITAILVGAPHDHDRVPMRAPEVQSPPMTWEDIQIRTCELAYRDEDIRPIDYGSYMRP